MGNKQYQKPSYQIQYQKSHQMLALPQSNGIEPLVFQGVSSPITPDYPLSCIGILRGNIKKHYNIGLAFVIHKNYIMACASNCYSHEIQQNYSNLSFTIRSRKTGIDKTFKVLNVFMPNQYRFLPRQQRESQNYAVLKIEEETNFEDQCGCISVRSTDMQKNNQQALKNQKTAQILYIDHNENSTSFCMKSLQLQYLSLLSQNLIFTFENNIKMNGVPIVMYSKGNFQALGIGFKAHKNQNNFMTILKFNSMMINNICQWSAEKYGQISLNLQQQKLETLVDYLRNRQIGHINSLIIYARQANSVNVLLNLIPFKHSAHIKIYAKLEGQWNNFALLQSRKLNNLRTLSLSSASQRQIGLRICQNIVQASLANLKQLRLFNVIVSDEGYDILKNGNWLLISIYQVNCKTKIINFASLRQASWINLRQFEVNLSDLSISHSKLYKNLLPPHDKWISLRSLSLSENMIDSRGCKMIKQSNFILRTLYLQNNQINDAGVRWICKANLISLKEFNLKNNPIGTNCLFDLVKARMSSIEVITISVILDNMTPSRIVALFKVEWNYLQLSCLLKELYTHHKFWRLPFRTQFKNKFSIM